MKNHIDQVTKNVMFNSKLSLADPQFNSKILSQISLELNRKVKRKLLAIYILIFMTIVTAACLVMIVFKINIILHFETMAYFIPIPLLLLAKMTIAPDFKSSNTRLSVT